MKNKIFIFYLCIIMIIASTMVIASAAIADDGIIGGDCIHTFDSDSGKCTICGGTCVHVYSSFDDYICNVCGYACQHSTVRSNFTKADNCTHTTKKYCTRCDYSESVISLHTGSTCSMCGATGCHSYETEAITKFEYKNEDKHTEYYECNDGCGSLKAVESGHVYGLGCKCPCGAEKHDIRNFFVSNLSFTTHDVVIACNHCELVESITTQEHIYLNSKCSVCGFICSHKSFDTDGHCNYCDYQCSHSSFDVTYTYLGNNKHNYLKKCSVCSKEFVNSTVDCSYNQSADQKTATCKRCEHSHTHTYVNGICSDCSYSCAHPSFDVTYTYLGNNKHNDLKKCSVCSKEFINATVDCLYNQSADQKTATCKDCEHSHTHTYVNGICSDCSYPCAHVFAFGSFSYDDIYEDWTYYDCFWCMACNGSYADVRNMSDSVPYFNRFFDNGLWNMESGGFEFTKKGDVVLPYRRFTIADFNNNLQHSASVNLIGGTNFLVDVGSIEYSRYFVVRLRYKDIEKFEFDIEGRNVYNGEFVSTTTMRVISQMYISTLPEDEWINIVIDIGSEAGYSHDKYSSSVESYKYMRMLLCFQYASADGYVDIDFAALAQNEAQIDKLCSITYGEQSTSSYYLYDGSFTLKTQTHSFSNEKCLYCNYQCPHTSYSRIPYYDKEFCGYDEACTVCDKVIVGASRNPHDFSGNSSKCQNCEYQCFHKFVNGYCKNCGWHCEHHYEGGHIKCTFCGMYWQSPAVQVNDGFYKLVTSIYDGQVNVFYSLLGYEILGVNIASMLIALIGFAIVIFVLKKVL